MISLTTVVLIIWIHFVADFMLQNDKMAVNKSTNNKWLGIHCLVYSVPFLLFGWQFALINGISHFIIDFCTSRGTSYLWKHEQRHWFFTLIGFDQALHLTVLLILIKEFM